MSLSRETIWVNYKLRCWKLEQLYDEHNRKLRKNILWIVATFFGLIGIIIVLVITHTP